MHHDAVELITFLDERHQLTFAKGLHAPSLLAARRTPRSGLGLGAPAAAEAEPAHQEDDQEHDENEGQHWALNGLSDWSCPSLPLSLRK
jgi:hypothetical protein